METKKIELRSDKVRNIIGATPSILLRIGLVIIGAVLLILLLCAYWVPYYQTVAVTDVQFYTSPNYSIVHAPKNGYIQWRLGIKSVQINDTLGLLIDNQESIAILATQAGNFTANCPNDFTVNQNTKIGWIQPNIQHVYAMAQVKASQIKLLQLGQQVKIASTIGVINQIFPIPNNNQYNIQIGLPLNVAQSIDFLETTTGRIVVSKQSILNTFMSRNTN